MSNQAHFEANRLNWDARTPGHTQSYGAVDFAESPGRISDVVEADAASLAPFLPGGSARGLRLIHLQCHIGTDTISWARLGADVTGVDLSPKSLETARDLARRAKLDLRFIEANVYEAARVAEGPYDVVYTSIGVLAWLPRLDTWARTIADLLAPGGLFFIREGHPVVAALAERNDDLLVLDEPYFAAGPVRYEDELSYTGSAIAAHRENYQWQHSMSEIIQSLLDAGLELLAFDEQRVLPWQALHFMIKVPGGWALPDRAERLPLTFSLVARRRA